MSDSEVRSGDVVELKAKSFFLRDNDALSFSALLETDISLFFERLSDRSNVFDAAETLWKEFDFSLLYSVAFAKIPTVSIVDQFYRLLFRRGFSSIDASSYSIMVYLAHKMWFAQPFTVNQLRRPIPVSLEDYSKLVKLYARVIATSNNDMKRLLGLLLALFENNAFRLVMEPVEEAQILYTEQPLSGFPQYRIILSSHFIEHRKTYKKCSRTLLESHYLARRTKKGWLQSRLNTTRRSSSCGLA